MPNFGVVEDVVRGLAYLVETLKLYTIFHVSLLNWILFFGYLHFARILIERLLAKFQAGTEQDVDDHRFEYMQQDDLEER